jgi:hypothetical protein
MYVCMYVFVFFRHYYIFSRTYKCPGSYAWGYVYIRLGITELDKKKFSIFCGIKRFVTQSLNSSTHNEPDEPCPQRRKLPCVVSRLILHIRISSPRAQSRSRRGPAIKFHCLF